jgi:hypothetical protein
VVRFRGCREERWGGGTSDTVSRSFCAGWCFVEPDGLRMFFVRDVWRAANLGLECRIESSIGGSILVVLRKEVLDGGGVDFGCRRG